ncbi:MAG: hypothetical protein AABZ47_08305 [Planctomycetota bacterium]
MRVVDIQDLRHFAIVVAAMVATLVPARAIAGSGSSTFDQLRDSDFAMQPTFTLIVWSEQPANSAFPEQGYTKSKCRMTRQGSQTALACVAIEFPTPIYSPSHQDFDYDDEQNLIVHMLADHYALWDDTINNECWDVQSFRVSPAGKVLHSSRGSVTHNLYRPNPSGNSLGATKVRRACWGLGHGLTTRLGEIQSEVTLSNGLHEIRVREPSTTSVADDWLMTMSCEGQCVVRTALAFRAPIEHPFTEITTEGARKIGEFILATRGRIRDFNGPRHFMEHRIELVDFFPTFNQQFLDEVRLKLKKTESEEPNVRVLDFRDNPSSPTITRLRSTGGCGP